MRYDGRDPSGRCAPRRVQHQEQFEDALLHGCHQRLNEKDVALAAVRLQLDGQAVVGKALELARQQRDFKMAADFLRQLRMRASAENGDSAHAGSHGALAVPRWAAYARRCRGQQEWLAVPRGRARRSSVGLGARRGPKVALVYKKGPNPIYRLGALGRQGGAWRCKMGQADTVGVTIAARGKFETRAHPGATNFGRMHERAARAIG